MFSVKENLAKWKARSSSRENTHPILSPDYLAILHFTSVSFTKHTSTKENLSQFNFFNYSAEDKNIDCSIPILMSLKNLIVM